MIELNEVVYEPKASGKWCLLPYPNHDKGDKKGCPNFPKCPAQRADFKLLEKEYNWFAVTEEFDLKAQEERMRELHPNWSKRQCRNLLYWQSKVRKKLREKAEKVRRPFCGDVVLDIPEAHGIDMFKTMEKVGIKLQRNPDLVIKVMLIGRRKEN